MPPFLYGGDMIEFVTEESSTFAPLPNKFEAEHRMWKGLLH